MRTSRPVMRFYDLATELTRGVVEFAAALEPRDPQLAAELRGRGPRGVAELASQAAQRIDLAPPLKRMAHALHAKAQALNPGERASAAAGRLFGASGGGGSSSTSGGAIVAAKGSSIAGWWTEIPQCDSKVHRSL